MENEMVVFVFTWTSSVYLLRQRSFAMFWQLRDEDLSKEMQESNWFSAPSALRVYGQYLNLDKDHNGMLSKAELAR